MDNQLLPTKQRIITLDIIRGFALLGILFVNMQFFNMPKLFLLMAEMIMYESTISHLAINFISIFATMKFVTIFSFLFGLGFFLFMKRVEEKSLSVTKLYSRRLYFLLLLGITHGIFIWSGDILLPYAIAGFFLLFFRHVEAGTVKKWAIWMYGIVTVAIGFLTYLSSVISAVVPSSSEGNYMNNLIEESLQVYATGNFSDILAFRIEEEVPIILMNLIFTVPLVLAVFLFGLYVGKKGILNNFHEHKELVLSVWKKSFAYFFITTIFYMALKLEFLVAPFFLQDSLLEILNNVNGIVGCFFYLSSIALLLEKDLWKKRLQFLAPVGQMALTNYLLQTTICILLFYGFGLGLYGTIPPEIGLVITVVIFQFQVLISRLWLRKFAYGPVEWLWRAFTYQTFPVLKKERQD